MKNKSKTQYDKIVSEVSKFYNVDKRKLYKRSRKRDVLEPRQVAHYLLMMSRFTCVEIAKDFNMHYSTVLNSVNKVKYYLPREIGLVLAVRIIENNLLTSKNIFV